jgi:hypothetical protein
MPCEPCGPVTPPPTDPITLNETFALPTAEPVPGVIVTAIVLLLTKFNLTLDTVERLLAETITVFAALSMELNMFFPPTLSVPLMLTLPNDAFPTFAVDANKFPIFAFVAVSRPLMLALPAIKVPTVRIFSTTAFDLTWRPVAIVVFERRRSPASLSY